MMKLLRVRQRTVALLALLTVLALSPRTALCAPQRQDGSPLLMDVAISPPGSPASDPEQDPHGRIIDYSAGGAYEASNSAQWPVVQVSTDSGADRAPSITQAADGTLWVVWDSSRSGNADIWCRTSGDGGVTWSAAAQLTTHTGSDHSPTIAQAGDGTMYLVWVSHRSGNSDLWFKTSNDNGTTWSFETQLTDDLKSDSAPETAALSDGSLWVVWQAQRPWRLGFGYHQHVHGIFSADGGTTWSDETCLSSPSEYPYDWLRPTMGQAPSGRLWVAWGTMSHKGGHSSPWGILGIASDDGGASWSREDWLVSDYRYSDYDPALVGSPDGTIWLSWEQSTDHGHDVYLKSSANDGDSWSAEQAWTRYVGQDGEPALAALSDGRVAVVWSSARSGEGDIWFGIIGQHEDLDPPPVVGSVGHRPQPMPVEGDVITIRAYAADETALVSVDLRWIVDGVHHRDPMFDDGMHDDGWAGDGRYALQIGSWPAGTVIDYWVEAEDVDENTASSPREPARLVVLEPFVKASAILLVVDGGAWLDTAWLQGQYAQALADKGWAYDLWDTKLRGIPEWVLFQYLDGAVVWAHAGRPSYLSCTDYGPGYDPSFCLQNDIWIGDTSARLSFYLDDGGRLVISGRELLSEPIWEFRRDYLHAQYPESHFDVSGTPLVGTPGDPIGDGLALLVSSEGGAGPYVIDGTQPLGPAVTVFAHSGDVPAGSQWSAQPDQAQANRQSETAAAQQAAAGRTPDVRQQSIDWAAGLRVDTGTYKVVCFAFGIEAISSRADRALVMERSLVWLGLNRPPELGTVDPSAGTGAAAVTAAFTTTWNDPDGWEDLKHVYFHIGDSPSLAGSVTLLYNAVQDKLWMRSDDGAAWLGGHAPGSANVLENSQAIVHCDQTTVQGAGDALSVTWAIEFKPGYMGTKKVGLKATDMSAARAKAAWKGTWTTIQADLKITQLRYWGDDEYVEITNPGQDAQDMTGWQIQTMRGNQWYSFPPGYTLPAGDHVRVHSGPEAWSSWPVHLKWTTAYRWSDGDDEARLYDAYGSLVDSWAY